jgi:hypothetical protein
VTSQDSLLSHGRSHIQSGVVGGRLEGHVGDGHLALRTTGVVVEVPALGCGNLSNVAAADEHTEVGRALHAIATLGIVNYRIASEF